jgi:hypothetical protein
MRSSLILLLLAGCGTENNLNGKETDPAFDPGDTATDPITDTADTDVVPEDCNGEDDNGDGNIDEGFPDDDGNGRADCMDRECPVLDLGSAGVVDILEECSGTSTSIVDDPWNAAIEWQYTVSSGSGVIVMPAVGNLTDDNGDGRVDEDDTPDIAFSTWSSNTLVALNGDGTGELFEISGFDGQGGVTIADVDSDGTPDIVAIETGGRIAAVDATGSIKWTSATFPMMAYPQPTVADLDNDGEVEVIGDVGVVEGTDGRTVATLSGMTNSWRTPVAADLDQDGQQEIILANKVFDMDGNTLWTNSGTGSGNFAAVADVDGDPGGEVFFVSNGMAYLHDDDGSLITSFPVPGGVIPGPPAIADFDGDGQVELAVPNSTQISVFETDGTLDWSARMQDNSGLAGCSGYDVNGDGAYEVLFADEIAFRIYDGATGAILYENTNHSSGTVWEYPVIADVDNDGSAEIVVADNGGAWHGITVFGHAGSVGWPKSGTTWATHDFAVTNIEADGHVPSPPDPSWQIYNVFRARPSVDDPSSADLVVSITDVCVADCDYGPVELGIQVANQGGADVDAGTIVAIYADDGVPRLISTVTLPAIPAGTLLDGIQVDLGPEDVGDYGFLAVVDDDGTGTDDVGECDETNNTDMWTDVFCP